MKSMTHAWWQYNCQFHCCNSRCARCQPLKKHMKRRRPNPINTTRRNTPIPAWKLHFTCVCDESMCADSRATRRDYLRFCWRGGSETRQFHYQHHGAYFFHESGVVLMRIESCTESSAWKTARQPRTIRKRLRARSVNFGEFLII